MIKGQPMRIMVFVPFVFLFSSVFANAQTKEDKTEIQKVLSVRQLPDTMHFDIGERRIDVECKEQLL